MVGLRLGELAQRIGAELRGDAELRVARVASLDEAGPGSVAFLNDPRYRRYLPHTLATAVILPADQAQDCAVAALITANPYLAFARAAALLHPAPAPEPTIHPSAVVDPTAALGAGVSVGPAAVVSAGVVVGEGSALAAGAYLGPEAKIGRDCRVGVNVVIGDRVAVGDRAIIHGGTVIGSDGFGFANDRGRWVKVPQLGTVRIGDDVEIGANVAIDRGALGDTVIEDGVKLDNLVHIAHNCHIGAHTVIAAAVGMAGSTVIGKHCAVAGMAGFAGHISIADGVTIMGMTAVTHSIKEPGMYSSGTQIAPSQKWRKNAVRFNQLDEMYRRLRELEAELAELKAKKSSE